MENQENIFHEGNFQGLLDRLQKIKDTSKDFVVRSEGIIARPIKDKETYETSGYHLNFGEHSLPLRPWAEKQVMQKLDIPYRYADRMKQAGAWDLLCANVNTWMPNLKKRLIRTTEGNIRAFLSDRYKAIDNHDLAILAYDIAKKNNLIFQEANLSENHLYLRILDMNTPYTVMEEDGRNDIYYAGVTLANSEVGDGACWAKPFGFRSACSNRALIGKKILRQIHLGQRLDEGIYTPETIQAESKTLYLKIRDLLTATFEKSIFEKWLAELKKTLENKIENMVEVVENISVNYNLSETEKKRILQNITEDTTIPSKARGTQYALMNAITMSAKVMETERMVFLENLGGEIATLPVEELTVKA